MKYGENQMRRVWTRQTAVLACAAVVVFWGFYTFDHLASLRTVNGPTGLASPLLRYLAFDPASLSNAVSSLSGVNAAAFGIVVTVVSIIVQLTAGRYTGVTRMFLRDRVSMAVAAYYVVACVVSVWLSASVQSNYIPRVTVTVVLSMTTGGLVIMAPYFSYVFWFLEPRNIIARIRKDAVAAATSGTLEHNEPACFAAQAQTLAALEELTDIASNSIAARDKIIASAAVDALKDLALEYIRAKSQASDAWLSIGPEIRLNPDFVAMDPDSLSDLEMRGAWVEWKVMRQYLSIYNDALASMRDIDYLIAIDTRYIGEAAADANDIHLIEFVFRFFNSYLRASLNARDVRTTYNVLNQYRKFLESMLRHGNHKAALDGAKHMKYYGVVSFDMNLSFVTETVAYDLSALAQLANELASPAEGEILNCFLGLDQPVFVREQETALLGVRKAQVKLAAHYLASGQEERARSIAEDMRGEAHERLLTIRRQLERVENKDFWEIIDRGRNFEYLPPEYQACLATFFEWLNVSISTPSPSE